MAQERVAEMETEEVTIVQLSELRATVAKALREGKPVAILDGEERIAKVVFEETPDITPEEHLDELVRQGKATRGTGELPDDFFTRPRPKLDGGSALQQLLQDRRSKDW
jgi:hypothetical protein